MQGGGKEKHYIIIICFLVLTVKESLLKPSRHSLSVPIVVLMSDTNAKLILSYESQSVLNSVLFTF